MKKAVIVVGAHYVGKTRAINKFKVSIGMAKGKRVFMHWGIFYDKFVPISEKDKAEPKGIKRKIDGVILSSSVEETGDSEYKKKERAVERLFEKYVDKNCIKRNVNCKNRKTGQLNKDADCIKRDVDCIDIGVDCVVCAAHPNNKDDKKVSLLDKWECEFRKRGYKIKHVEIESKIGDNEDKINAKAEEIYEHLKGIV